MIKDAVLHLATGIRSDAAIGYAVSVARAFESHLAERPLGASWSLGKESAGSREVTMAKKRKARKSAAKRATKRASAKKAKAAPRKAKKAAQRAAKKPARRKRAGARKRGASAAPQVRTEIVDVIE